MGDKEKSEEIDLIVDWLYNNKIEIRDLVQKSLKQDEQVRELEKRCKRLKKHVWEARNEVSSQSTLLDKERGRSGRYRKALEFYASELSWRYDLDYDALRDKGDKAREALEEME